MKVKYTINNYILGARLRMVEQYGLISKTRIDPRHTEVVFELPDDKNGTTKMEFINKVLTYKGRII